MMFQAAGVYGLAKQTGHSFGLFDLPLPPKKHSELDYSTTILKPLTKFILPPLPNIYVHEDNSKPIDLEFLRASPNTVIRMIGYFQHTAYIQPFKEEALKLFSLPSAEEDEDAYFLHVRRGDYVSNNWHELDLSAYYKRAVDRIGGGVAKVVSNDVEWCESWDFLNDVRHVVVRENEIDTMAIMAACGKGGVAANSSFSWWGLYLNTNRPHLILPNRWFPHDWEYDTSRYHFLGSAVLEV